MTFEAFQKVIHSKGFQIVCLNDYKLQGEQHTFIAIQNKTGQGYHAEGKTEELAGVCAQLLEKLEG
jgi:hypothetical protein